MPRAKTVLQCEFPYHVTARCLNKEWYKIPIDEVWEIYSRELTMITWLFNAQIVSFVLMNNHFHLIIVTPDSNLNKIMAYFMKTTSNAINEKSKRINQVYGSRYYKTIINNPHYFLHAYKYVYRNPVEASLAEKCEEYPFSSLNFKLGGSLASFPTIADQTLFSSLDETLNWLNRKPENQYWSDVGNALKKSVFKLKIDKNTRAYHPLEKDLF